MKIWYDDIRRPPDDSWEWARTNAEAFHLLKTIHVKRMDFDEMSLDHDMGLHHHDPDAKLTFDPDLNLVSDGWEYEDGLEIAQWMCDHGVFPEKRITIHSWNPDGAKRMAALFNDHGQDCLVQPFTLK